MKTLIRGCGWVVITLWVSGFAFAARPQFSSPRAAAIRYAVEKMNGTPEVRKRLGRKISGRHLESQAPTTMRWGLDSDAQYWQVMTRKRVFDGIQSFSIGYMVLKVQHITNALGKTGWVVTKLVELSTAKKDRKGEIHIRDMRRGAEP